MEEPIEGDSDIPVITNEISQTFVFKNEDHTLGNSLRCVLMKNPDVSFCGYSIPHPFDHLVNLRLQTNGKPSNEVLRDGLHDLKSICEIMKEKYVEAQKDFASQQKQ